MSAHDPTNLPANLPIPLDDGACEHLGRGRFSRLPSVVLRCTDGTDVDMGQWAHGPEARATVVFFYPRTGVPGQPPNLGFNGEDWDTIPGARGCTPQSCGFRDSFTEFARRNIAVFGVSTNTTEHQAEFKRRMHMPFEFLSDSELRLVRALRLPTFEFPVESGGGGGTTLLRRMAMYCERGRIVKVWYPVFPPDRNAEMVLHWLAHRPARAAHTVRAIEARDLEWVRAELMRNWHATEISSRGRWFQADQLPGFIAESGGKPVALVTHTSPLPGGECEVVTLSSGVEGAGIGARLLEECAGAARNAGCTRIFLTTTNDNLHALGFYQRRGWAIAAVLVKEMERARRVKPSIPTMGMNGIPIRDEIELEIVFSGERL